ncbi:uncharacterized protein SETTUDRAFT_105110 [Exserohilum turcica Et28A]|uniref:F-box domain-containing protein n=1 Tax=Exserohilum turcicum (strain 28A) TaxID=671987 RepID=R0KJA7_EXST2|nr:uncharacterized protein SETTUDRAFT_105110 [Exserohilum turcica Et28A]EOA89254.1 hypothetical protein SETTUDRAFT_105110 [Exserohilum turcica Et28A]
MAQSASPPVLAPRVPDAQAKGDLTDYAASAKAHATSKKYMQDLFPGQNKPLPLLRDIEVQERAKPSHSVPQRHALEERVSAPTIDNRLDPRSLECLIMLDQSSVSGIETSPASSASASARYQNNARPAAAPVTRSAKGSHRFKRPRRSLLQLPQGILGHILAYVFAEERAISITPYQPQVTPQRYRHRHGAGTVDIRTFMMHPALLVCHQMRAMGLNIVYRNNLFVINLCEANRAAHANERDSGKHWDCWTAASPPPHMVQTALTHASILRIELPVPSAEPAAVRGATKRKKDSHEDKGVVLESLRRLTALIIGSSPVSQPERTRAPSPAAPKALRRKLSFRSVRRHDSLEFVCRGDSPPLFVREPLSSFEVVLVKPALTAPVHSHTLEMVTMCSAIPVSRTLAYYLELDGLRKLWAKRTLGKWRGSEPDGPRLLHGMHMLPSSLVSRQPSLRRTRSSSTSVAPTATATATGGSPPSLPSHRHLPVSLKEGSVSVAGKFREMEHLYKITFLKSSTNKHSPSIGEIQHITSDMRRGVH